MGTELTLAEDKLSVIEQRTEAWKHDDQRTRQVDFLENLIEDLLAVEKTMQHSLARARRRLHAEVSYSPFEDGPLYLKVLRHLSAASQIIERETIQAARDGYTVEKASELRSGVRRIEEAMKTFLLEWPQYDPVAVDAAACRAREGKVLSLSEVRRELGLGD